MAYLRGNRAELAKLLQKISYHSQGISKLGKHATASFAGDDSEVHYVEIPVGVAVCFASGQAARTYWLGI